MDYRYLLLSILILGSAGITLWLLRPKSPPCPHCGGPLTQTKYGFHFECSDCSHDPS